MSASRLAQAQYLLDQHFSNVYFKIDVVAVCVAGMVWTFCAIVPAVLALAWWLPQTAPDLVIRSGSQTAAVLLLGAVGAALSYALSTLGFAGRIPGQLNSVQQFVVRPLLGAVSAFAVVAVLQSGLLPITTPEGAHVYAYAVAAGFSDQILTRVMNVVEKSASK